VPRRIWTRTDTDYWAPLAEDKHPKPLEVDYDYQHSGTSDQYVAPEEDPCEEWICPVCEKRTSTEASDRLASPSGRPKCGTGPRKGKDKEIPTAATSGLQGC